MNGTAIPLLYVSASQINAEIPGPLYGTDSAEVQVVYNTVVLPDFRVEMDASIFGIFENPTDQVAAINQDGTVNSSSNPAKAGTIVSIWGTGFGNAAMTVTATVTKVANNWCTECQISTGNSSKPCIRRHGARADRWTHADQLHGPARIEHQPKPVVFSSSAWAVSGLVWVSQ